VPVYTYVTLSTLLQELANRLYDSSMTFWTSAELTAYVQESLRTFNALTSYWRGDFVFPTVPSTTWMDLTAVPNSLVPYTLFDTDLYNVIEYHLLEPPTGSAWTGSSQFTADDLINAVARRRDEILSVCGCTTTRHTVPAVAGRIALPDIVLDVRRMAYVPTPPQLPSVVWQDDAWAAQSFSPSFPLNPAGTPFTFRLSTQPPISFDTDRPPAYAGSYEVLTIDAGAMLAAGSPQHLSIPDDWTHVIKWGALADLLMRDGEARDTLRAQYCEGRYQMGLRLLADAAMLLTMRVGNQVMQIDAVRSGDLYNPTWQAASASAPTLAYHSGLNLIGLSPVPNTGPYSLTATVVQNAPVPSLSTDQIQMGRDDYDAILDYSQHLAAFKLGGSEFSDTQPLLQRFMRQASVYNSKLSELGEYTATLLDIAQRENDVNPRLAPTAPGGAT
jgi:hypothetical protein